jgi:hypothetical protein
MAALFLVLWLACGVWNAGLLYAHFQRKFELIADETRSTTLVLCVFSVFTGPVGVFATQVTGFYKHGWLLPGRRP